MAAKDDIVEIAGYGVGREFGPQAATTDQMRKIFTNLGQRQGMRIIGRYDQRDIEGFRFHEA